MCLSTENYTANLRFVEYKRKMKDDPTQRQYK